MADKSIHFGVKTITLEEYRLKEVTLTRPLTDGPMVCRANDVVSRSEQAKAESAVLSETAAVVGRLLG